MAWHGRNQGTETTEGTEITENGLAIRHNRKGVGAEDNLPEHPQPPPASPRDRRDLLGLALCRT